MMKMEWMIQDEECYGGCVVSKMHYVRCLMSVVFYMAHSPFSLRL